MIEATWWKEVIPPVLGVAGFVLSVFNFWKAQKKDKRQIRVDLRSSYITFENGSISDAIDTITVTNIGHRPVTVTQIGFEFSGKEIIVAMRGTLGPLTNDSLPKELRDGMAATHYFDSKEILANLIRNGPRGKIEARPFCKDSASNVYRGERTTFEC